MVRHLLFSSWVNSNHLLYRARATLGLPKAGNKKRNLRATFIYNHRYKCFVYPSCIILSSQHVGHQDGSSAKQSWRFGEESGRERRSQPAHYQTDARSDPGDVTACLAARWALPNVASAPLTMRGRSWAGPARLARCGPRGARGVRWRRCWGVHVTAHDRGAPTAWMRPAAKPVARIFCASPSQLP